MRGLQTLALLPLLRAVTAASHRYPYEDMPDVEPVSWIPHDRHLVRHESIQDRLFRRSQGRTHIFEHAATQTRLNYVANSGLCETTPNVGQHSGYMTVGANMNMWFWHFEARKDAKTAPLVAWFNGGPGCSSMIGLFQEHGPCQFYDGKTTPELNKYSWTEVANMIYIDQPIGTGFSYGTSNTSSSVTASPYVWKLLQSFYAAHPEYKSRDFGIFTESYGGHYGPEFTRYILEQNAKIDAGTLRGEKINIVALGINNGWINPADNYRAMIDFSLNNTYKPMITSEKAKTYREALETHCLPALDECSKLGTNAKCYRADSICKTRVENPIARNNFNPYDVRAPLEAKDTDPPPSYKRWLQQPAIQTKIGAKKYYEECPMAPATKFTLTGDDSRDFKPVLEKIVQTGTINVLIWAGDTDWICNWMGNLATANAISFAGQDKFRAASLRPYTVNGKMKGEFKSEANFHFLKVLEAGHEAAYYQPEVSLQAFAQIVAKKPLMPT